MKSKLLKCKKLEIPAALKLDHEMLRADLIRAAARRGQIGKAAKRLAQLFLPHFAEEEKNVIRVIGLLRAAASDRARRLRPDMTEVAPLIAGLSAQHLASLGPDKPINAAIDELLRQARKDGHGEITELVDKLKDHEQIEDQVMYPTLLFIDRSVFETLRT